MTVNSQLFTLSGLSRSDTIQEGREFYVGTIDPHAEKPFRVGLVGQVDFSAVQGGKERFEFRADFGECLRRVRSVEAVVDQELRIARGEGKLAGQGGILFEHLGGLEGEGEGRAEALAEGCAGSGLFADVEEAEFSVAEVGVDVGFVGNEDDAGAFVDVGVVGGIDELRYDQIPG